MRNQLSSDQLGRELREGSSRFLKHRHGIMGLSFFSSANHCAGCFRAKLNSVSPAATSICCLPSTI